MADRRSRLELGAWRPGRPKSGPSRHLRRRCRRRRQFRERCIPSRACHRRPKLPPCRSVVRDGCSILVLRLLMWLTRGPITAHAFHFDRPPFSSRNPLYSAFPNAPADPLANLLSHRQLEDSAAATAANESRRPGGSAAADKNGKLMYGTFHVQGHCRQRFTRISRGRLNPLVQADSIWPGYIIFTPSCPMLGPNRCRNFAGPPVSRTLLLHSVGLQRCNFG